MMKFFGVFSLLLMTFLINIKTSTIHARLFPNRNVTECNLSSKNYIFDINKRHYFNLMPTVIKFDSFKELENVCFPHSRQKVFVMVFFPINNYLLLDTNNFNLDIFLEHFYFSQKLKTIFFQKIKGFNLIFKTRPRAEYLNIDVVYFLESKFDFYLNGSQIADENHCEPKHFSPKFTNYFGSIREVEFLYNVIYSSRVCPLVFMNTLLKRITFNQISNSLIFKNQLKFINISHINNLNIKDLSVVTFYFAFERVTLETVNELVFKNVKLFSIKGVIYGIQPELFQNFTSLIMIRISIENLKEFIHSGQKWINSVNKDMHVHNIEKLNEQDKILKERKVLQIIEAQSIFRKLYEYPDEDLCMFKDFPHNQLVFPDIYTEKDSLSCSCTILWLLQYTRKYLYRDNILNSTNNLSDYFSLIKCYLQNDYSSHFNSCNFEQRFGNCPKKNYFYKTNFLQTNMINITFILKWTQYIIEVFLKPTLCLLGIVSSTITIVVLKNKRKKKSLNNFMYHHITANSIFNLIFCFTSGFSLINICIFPKSSFCSHFFKSDFSQSYKIYSLLFIGNAIKMCSNISYFSFSMSRFFISTSNKNSTFIKQLQNIRIKYYYSLICVLSLLFSIFRLFEYQKNEIYSIFEKKFPFNAYDIEYCSTISIDSKIFNLKCRLFSFLRIFNNVINNILFFFLTLIIDILLISFVGKNLVKKKALIIDKKKIKEAVKLKENVNKMVIRNGFLFIVSHFPEFVTTIFLTISRKTIASVCLSSLSCGEIIEITQITNFISIVFQIFIFLKFDRNFAESFNDLKDRFLMFFDNIFLLCRYRI